MAGYDVAAQPLEVKRRVGYVPESGAVYDNLTAAEYLELVASLHHLELARARQRSDELLELFGLVDDKDRRIAVGGMSEVYLAKPIEGASPAPLLVIKRLLPTAL